MENMARGGVDKSPDVQRDLARLSDASERWRTVDQHRRAGVGELDALIDRLKTQKSRWAVVNGGDAENSSSETAAIAWLS